MRLPWFYAESVGGKMEIYDNEGRPVFILNQSMTSRCSERSKKEIDEVMRFIVAAANLAKEL